MLRIIVCFCIAVAFANVACAEFYEWEDGNGLHFTENIGSVPKKYRAQALANAREKNESQATNGANDPKDTTSTARFSYCKQYDLNYSSETYEQLKAENEYWIKTCSEMKKALDIKYRGHRNAPSHLFMEYSKCNDKQNATGEARHSYYNCARNEGQLNLSW